MDTKQNNSKNQWVVWGCLITLIVGIFAFAQVYIALAIDAMNDRITRMENRSDERLRKIEERLDKLNQNYIDHLERHLSE